MEKFFQNLRVRLKFSIRQAMKIKLFVAREIQNFELRVFSFNSYVSYLTRGFISWTGSFNLLTCAFSLLTRGFELLICGFELVTRGFGLVTRGFELATRNSCFIFPPVKSANQRLFNQNQPLSRLVWNTVMGFVMAQLFTDCYETFRKI